MNIVMTVPLKVDSGQRESLERLQKQFADVCNAISPIAQLNRCWNRVALHHLVYKSMREMYPAMGSQMVCNAIYAVCRGYKLLSGLMKMKSYKTVGDLIITPRLFFLHNMPVYFDRHTLSVKEGGLSIFTLDGRIHFSIVLSEEKLNLFAKSKIKEVMLMNIKNNFELRFVFCDSDKTNLAPSKVGSKLPNYVVCIPASHDTNVNEVKSGVFYE